MVDGLPRAPSRDQEGLSKIGVNGPENEDISKSVSSIDSGSIFLLRSDQDLSRNGFVVSVYAL